MKSMRIAAIVALLIVAACGKTELYTDLTEIQANEMVAVLKNSGIDANKTVLDEGKWSIAAPDDDFSRAVQILRANGYPRDRFDTMGELFKKEGFVSSALEERARLNFGQTQELSNTISHIDGVVYARVHLATPAPDPLSETPKPASASVLIEHRPGVDLRPEVGKIKALIVNAIEGLSYDRVSVELFQAQPLPTVHPIERRGVADYAGLAVPALLGGAAFLAWPFLKRRGGRGRRTLTLRD